NEAHTVTYCSHSAGGNTKHLLEECVGLDNKQIAYMKRQGSRACTIFKNYPQCYLLQNEKGLFGPRSRRGAAATRAGVIVFGYLPL
ncbi:MAG: hypothetical protein ACKPKO_40090, partial [Candidatus Fonsibacter sp.]